MEPEAEAPIDLTTLEPHKDEFWPLSGKPYHGFVLAKSHVAPFNSMVLPAKITSLLPSIMIPAVLNCGGKKWVMSYHGNRRGKALDSRIWKKFVSDNCLKVGDGCIFELTECSSSLLKFRVQILRGDIPLQLRDKFSGESKDIPILIE